MPVNQLKFKTFSLVALLVLIFTQFAFSQDYIIRNFDATITINQDGTFDVHEKIDVDFTEKRRGIKRNIPKKIKHYGIVKRIELSNVQVNGDPFSMHSDGNNRIIRIGDIKKYITGLKSYDLKYTLKNAFLFEDDHTAFMYNLIADWDVPILAVKYRIILPTDLEMPFNDFKVVTGFDDEDKRRASMVKNGAIISGESFTALRPHENITLALKLPVDYITRPIPPKPKVPVFKRDKIWFLPMIFIGWFLGFFINSKKEDDESPVEDQYYPPKDFSPAEVGTYYDGTVHPEDIISLLPYWANKGYLTMTNNDLEGDLNDIFFRKIKTLPPGTPEYETVIFDGLFQKGNVVLLSELKNEIYKSYYKASSSLNKNLKSKALYDEDHYNMFHSGKMIGLFFFLLLGGAAISFFTPFTISGIVLIIAGFVCLIIHFISPKKSAYGIRVKRELKGLRNFLEKGDAEKTSELLKSDEKYFEKLFPYAVAFGIDKSWIEKLSDFDLNAPTWYGYENNTSSRANNLSTFSKDFSIPEIKSVFTSAPQSAASSGSSRSTFSGGRAGGGFGGGGSSW
ncbi:MAG: DUF2207 domain-containing protein [Saprospiraceae bacterium]|nr:DUF2207 domain-containing protein [Bacteroidia bacterium]NNE13892.1 DUF2207 domain-containing protein [Saprospiraceae bacterium]NNL92086.1 DUF2207 domain-containing protein [Saprospiraceae bacterium]